MIPTTMAGPTVFPLSTFLYKNPFFFHLHRCHEKAFFSAVFFSPDEMVLLTFLLLQIWPLFFFSRTASIDGQFFPLFFPFSNPFFFLSKFARR